MQKNAVLRMFRYGSLLATAALIAGCASDKGGSAAEKPAEKTPYKERHYAAEPTKVKFGQFTQVELKETVIAPPNDRKEANQKSARKIDEMLQQQLKFVFPHLKVVPAGAAFSKPAERTLQIAPVITDIRLVSVGGRVWLGAMAGGSDIVMHVEYRDSASGEVIANPDFWRGNNAWAGGASWGAADNQLRDAVVAQIVNYTTLNK